VYLSYATAFRYAVAFPSWRYCDHVLYVFATEARGLTDIVELRRYNRSKKLQTCVVISGFVVIDASLYPIFLHVLS